MYNLRYHIASLVAVFLALAVGLLLGTIVVERGLLNAQKTTLVAGLQKEFETNRTQIQDLKTRNDALAAYAAASVPEIVRGTLAGRTVVLLGDPDSGDILSHAAEAVRLAGGTPASVIFTGAGLSLGDAKVKDAAMKVLGSPAESQLRARVTEALALEWTSSDRSRALTNALVSAGGLRVQGLEPGVPLSATVVSAVRGSEADTATLALAEALASPSRPAAGVETTARRTGQAKAAAEGGLSAVDDIDEPLGKVSLIWVLSGRRSGHFGTGDGSTARFPDPLSGAN